MTSKPPSGMLLPSAPLVRLELARKEDKELIQVELTQERYCELQFKEMERVFVTLKLFRLFIDKEKQEAPRVSLD